MKYDINNGVRTQPWAGNLASKPIIASSIPNGDKVTLLLVSNALSSFALK